jgi:copper chaperone
MNLQVEKMSCQHCVRAVTQALQAIDPKAQVTVDLALARVEVRGDLSADSAIAALQDAGYPAHLPD